MKILLSAYSCLPNAGSEPGIGWNWAERIAARGHDVVVLTRANRRHLIEAEVAKRNIRNPRFLFHDLAPTVQKLYNLPFGSYAYYILWQYTAAKLAARVHVEENFDLIQHLTWGSFRLPSFMGKLAVPFIFGPVGGGEDTPNNLRRGLGWHGRFLDFLRRTANWLFTAMPFMRATYADAKQIVVTTQETLTRIPSAYRHKGIVQQAIGINAADLQAFSKRDSRAADQLRAKLRLLFVGRLLPWKGVHIALKAIRQLEVLSHDVHLTIVGSGPDEGRLVSLTRKLGLAGSVAWVPWMEREQLIQFYSQFDLFVFPSLHDSGGMAVLEAMSLGLPVACLDLGGPGASVDDCSGRVVKTRRRSEEDVVADLAGFLGEILVNPALLTEYSAGARRRALSLTWEASVSGVYSEIFVPLEA